MTTALMIALLSVMTGIGLALLISSLAVLAYGVYRSFRQPGSPVRRNDAKGTEAEA